MAVSLLTSKILAAGAGALAGYLLYKPEKKSGNNGGKNKENKDWFVPKVDLNSGAAVMNAVTVEAYEENPYEFGRVLEGDVTDSRVNRPYYLGDRNKPYDPFYDYTDTTDKELLTQGGELAAPFHFVRARILPEYFAFDKEFVDYLGWYREEQNYGAVPVFADYLVWRKLLLIQGWKAGVRFRVEIFNPGVNPIRLTHLGIEQVEINNIHVQPFFDVYRGSKTEPIDIEKDRENWDIGFIVNEDQATYSDSNRKYTKGQFYHGTYSGVRHDMDFSAICAELKKNAWGGFYYPYDYTPENIPAQGSLFQDWFLPNLYPVDSLISIKYWGRNAYEFKMENPPVEDIWSKSDGGSFFVKMKFASNGEDAIIEAALWRGEKTYGEKLPARAWTEYIGSNLFSNIFSASNTSAEILWRRINEQFKKDFDSSFGVDMAAYWYLWAVNKAALEAKIKSILGVDPKEFDLSTTPARRLQMLKNEVYEKATSEQKQQLNELLTLWRNVFKSTELTISEAVKTYQETYKNDVTKGVTLLPSLKYWAEQAAGAAPESIAPGTSSRSGNTNRNAVPDYRGTSAGTSTTTTTTTTNGGGRGGSSVNGMAPGYQAASM